jgi:hypothetical protein
MMGVSLIYMEVMYAGIAGAIACRHAAHPADVH